jgi:ABC-type dipeptide/oligopeptide/nickel transport system permease subunit
VTAEAVADDLPSRQARRRFVRNRSAVIGSILVLVIVLFALVGPIVSRHDPLVTDLVTGIDRATGLPAAPSSQFWLGTDLLFRDVLARLAVGARLSLTIGLASTAIATAIGTLIGIMAGWFEGERGVRIPGLALAALVGSAGAIAYERPLLGGVLALAGIAIATLAVVRPSNRVWTRGPFIDVDLVLMRAVDIGLSFPFLLLVMAISAAVEHTNVVTILLLLGLTGWLGTARIVRAKTMQVRRLEFVEAARALGHGTPQILFFHILPNVAGPVVVIATAQVAQMILAESVLSYLGAGVAPPTPTWGGMLAEGQVYLGVAPWLVVSPALCLLLTVLGFNLMGEGLRDALDPREAR